MKTLFGLILFTLTSVSFAQALPDINGLLKDKTFVDFTHVDYTIEVDLEQQIITTKTKINLEQKNPGHIIFDLKKPCLKVKVDGRLSKTRSFVLPRSFGVAKNVSVFTKPGKHTLEVETRLKKGVSFSDDLDMGFWIRDLFGRRFLEQYLPTNFEYDQYQANLTIKFLNGDQSPYTLMANGDIHKIKDGYFVKFPKFYTASSFFIHLIKRSNYIIDRDVYKRADGVTIDFITYSRSKEFTARLKARTLSSMKSLEEYYGTWPHDYLIIFGDQDSGGMEHAGATQTSFSSLDHELHHSYIGKAVIPRNGNAGWMDEAIVTWRDRGYPLFEQMPDKRENLACHSVHRRATDWDSYEKGHQFIGHLASLFESKGMDLNLILKEWFQSYKYKIVTTKIFRSFLESYYGESLHAKFKRHTCGNRNFGEF